MFHSALVWSFLGTAGRLHGTTPSLLLTWKTLSCKRPLCLLHTLHADRWDGRNAFIQGWVKDKWKVAHFIFDRLQAVCCHAICGRTQQTLLSRGFLLQE